MQAAITTESFLAFLSYFGLGLGLLIAGVAVVALITPHRDITLIRNGNAAAATAFAGTLLGIALPLQAAITHSVSLADAMIWGVVSTLIQVVAYALARLVSSRISHQITENVSAAGIFSAGVSISVGLINAAAMTP